MSKAKLIVVALIVVAFGISVIFNACSDNSFSKNKNNSTVVIKECEKDPSKCPDPPGTGGDKEQFVDVSQGGKVDILFVIDNSWTMNYEHQNTAQRISNFLGHLDNLDWQIAVTTTNVSETDAEGLDGRLLPLYGVANQYVLDKNTFNAQSILGDTIQVESMRDSVRAYEVNLEQGIYATYRAIERYLIAEVHHKKLLRDGAQFAVVLISDEDESTFGAEVSTQFNIHTHTDHKNTAEDLIDIVNSTWGGRKVFSYHSIVALEDACISTEGESLGLEYERLSLLTGGIVGSVCSNDYSSQLSAIGESVVELLKTVSLSCVPQAGSLKITRKISDTANETDYNGTYVLDGQKLNFDERLPVGKYKFSYSCD